MQNPSEVENKTDPSERVTPPQHTPEQRNGNEEKGHFEKQDDGLQNEELKVDNPEDPQIHPENDIHDQDRSIDPQPPNTIQNNSLNSERSNYGGS